MPVRRLITALLCAAALSGGAGAQGLLGSLDGIGLSNDDYTLLTEAAATLYTAETPEIGAEEIWSNPETRSHGTVELVSHDGTCAVIRHLFRVGSTKDVHRVQSRRCRAADGTWKISTE